MVMTRLMTRPGMIAIAACLVSGAALAGEAGIKAARITRESPGIYRFDVTVRHGDTAWTHYADKWADKWDVVGPGGKTLGTRVLLHPHELEQPFTSSLRGVRITRGIVSVTVRAHDKIHGYGGKIVTLAVPRDGEGS
jgi:hypothetical protein